MAAQLKATVFVKDPDTRQTIALAPGTCPEPRLAALVTNPAAWVDGKLPRLRTTQKPEQDPEGGDGPGTGPDPADSGTSSDDDSTPSSEDEQTDNEPTPAKPTRKTAARKPAADQ